MKSIFYFFSFIFFLSACNSEFKKEFCDREKTKAVFIPRKNILKYLNVKRESNLKIIVDSILGYSGRVEFDLSRKKQVDNIIDSLNQINVFYNQNINAYYAGLLADYCNPETVKKYFAAVDSIKRDMKELEILKIQISKISASNGIGGNNITDLFVAVDSYFTKRK